MPNIKSAKKRVKVTAVKTERNKAQNSALKTTVKKAVTAIDTSSADMSVAVSAAFKSIDKAAAKGLMHKNTAARKKSALARKMNAAV